MVAESAGATGWSNSRWRRLPAFVLLGTVAAYAPSITQAEERGPEPELGAPWQVRCLKNEGPKEAGNCEATLRISNRGEQIAELAIGRMQGADDLIVAGRVPLGVQLQEGLLLGSDPDNTISVPYSNCLPNGCVAHIVAKRSEVSRLLSRGQTYLSFRERSGRTVRIAIPSDGLYRALALLGIESGS